MSSQFLKYQKSFISPFPANIEISGKTLRFILQNKDNDVYAYDFYGTEKYIFLCANDFALDLLDLHLILHLFALDYTIANRVLYIK